MVRLPAERTQHFGGEDTSTFDVDQADDVPVIVDEDVALVKVVNAKTNGPSRRCLSVNLGRMGRIAFNAAN